MKERVGKRLYAVMMLFFSLFVTSIAFAEEDPALVAKGKELFENKAGLNTKLACILCHKGEKALKPARITELGDALPDTINKYMVEKAKGTAIAKDSEEMKALMAYLRSGQS
ncbi:MAG TPA: hypothetical protein VJA00_00665 [Candidatus Omnitrophota bacterium]|nr:hypothetical protein [Candidatus Omnitrophota bacterium]